MFWGEKLFLNLPFDSSQEFLREFLEYLVFLAIEAIFLEKQPKIQILAFLDAFQKNGFRYAKKALRNLYDGSNCKF